jgi:hypothetical protein
LGFPLVSSPGTYRGFLIGQLDGLSLSRMILFFLHLISHAEQMQTDNKHFKINEISDRECGANDHLEGRVQIERNALDLECFAQSTSGAFQSNGTHQQRASLRHRPNTYFLLDGNQKDAT